MAITYLKQNPNLEQCWRRGWKTGHRTDVTVVVALAVATSMMTVAVALVAVAAGDGESDCLVCWKETKALLCRHRERIKDEKGGVWLVWE